MGPVAPLALPLALVFVLLLVAWRGPLWRPRPLFPDAPRLERPRLLGHRGVRGPLPENSVAAVAHALEAGLDGVEIDVQRTRDGALVLHHDLDLGGRAVTALRWDDVRRLEPTVPRLDDLAPLLTRWPEAVVNVELKVRPGGVGGVRCAWAVARWLRRRRLGGRALVSSFDPATLGWFRLFAPAVRVGLLTAPELPAPLARGALAGWLHADALHPHHSAVDARTTERAAARGLAVATWTVNDPREVSRVAALGVAGIIGDDPAALLRGAARAGRAPAGPTPTPGPPAPLAETEEGPA